MQANSAINIWAPHSPSHKYCHRSLKGGDGKYSILPSYSVCSGVQCKVLKGTQYICNTHGDLTLFVWTLRALLLIAGSFFFPKGWLSRDEIRKDQTFTFSPNSHGFHPDPKSIWITFAQLLNISYDQYDMGKVALSYYTAALTLI